jgi:hypothetical protein
MMKIQLKRMRGRNHKMLTGKEKRSKCDRRNVAAGWIFRSQIGKRV